MTCETCYNGETKTDYVSSTIATVLHILCRQWDVSKLAALLEAIDLVRTVSPEEINAEDEVETFFPRTNA